MASNSGFTRNLPSGQSKVSTTDEEFRSLKSFIETWIEQEHYALGGSSSSAGVHRMGSARVYRGATSLLSNPTGDGDGRLLWSTTGVLYVANASTSSWSAVADAIQLDSAQTWTALQEFTSGVSASNATLGGLAISGFASRFVSYQTVLASAITFAPNDHRNSLLTTVSDFRQGDPLFLGIHEPSPGGAGTNPGLVAFAFIQDSSGRINVVFKSVATAGSSIRTLESGTTITVAGFRLV